MPQVFIVKKKIVYRMVSTYLVHHGYCDTAEAFAKSTGQAFEEDFSSIKNRQSKHQLIFIIKYKIKLSNKILVEFLRNSKARISWSYG